ncbi:MAG: hypothetical protein M3019_12190 [Candidatus Dormibacteraeota bacterium]|nr:hypothetical protein [Candidatus Dormibacteraeota bacterium]MDQ6946665.1 hypothetical protein [Actinomycetota bacterium]
MSKTAFAVPVLPGKDAKSIPAIFSGRSDDYAESRSKHGVTMERVYEQSTPMGTFAVAYVESTDDFGATLGSMAASDLPIDREFLGGLKDVHGLDLSGPAGEPPEVLGDWRDDAITQRKRGFAFCAPIRPDATEKGRAFSKEAFETRRDEHGASRRALGLNQETVVLNHTPHGDILCVYLEGDDPVQANRRFAESKSEYDTWFKDQCKEIFPPEIDFNEPVPPVTQIFDSQEALVAR